jgi:hypothetical protein
MVPVHHLDAFGINRDLPPEKLQPETFNDGQNARFANGAVSKMPGYSSAFSTPLHAPHFLLPVRTPTSDLWLYAGLAKVSAFSAGTHADITRAAGGDYAASVTARWTGGVLGGLGVINNISDIPQVWNPPGLGQQLVDLPNWPSTLRARALRPFGNFLVALDVIKSGVRFAHTVKWSHPADPGTVPSTWDEADATKLAGEVPLSHTSGGCVDCLPLGNVNVIYKQDSTYIMQFLPGSVEVFAFPSVSSVSGVISVNCAVEVPDTSGSGRPRGHFVGTGEDLVLFDGNQMVSLVDRRVKQWLSRTLSAANADRCFCVNDYTLGESYFVFPDSDGIDANTAISWNWKSGAIGDRRFPDGVAHGDVGPFDKIVASDVWDNQNVVWDSAEGVWDAGDKRSGYKTLLAQPDPALVLLLNDGNSQNGKGFAFQVQRTGLTLTGEDRGKSPAADFGRKYMMTGAWFQGKGKINVFLGAQDRPEGSVKWKGPKQLDISKDRRVNLVVSGVLLAIRLEYEGPDAVSITSYGPDIVPLGVF